MAIGLLILIYSMWMMTAWTPDVSQFDIIVSILLQGAGLGFVFIPLQVLSFATLPAHTAPTARRCSACSATSAARSAFPSCRRRWRQQPGAARADRRRRDAVQPRAAGGRCRQPVLGSRHATGSRLHRPRCHPAGVDHRLCQRFQADDAHHGSGLLLLLLLRRPKRGSAAAPAETHAIMD